MLLAVAQFNLAGRGMYLAIQRETLATRSNIFFTIPFDPFLELR